MKVTLDLDKLLNDGEITNAEYTKFSNLAAETTGSLAYNILIAFGVTSVSLALLAMLPSPFTAFLMGILLLFAGIFFVRKEVKQWFVLANILVVAGALMAGGAIFSVSRGDKISFLIIAVIYTIAAIYAKSGLLSAMATLVLSSFFGASTGYSHATYSVFISKPLLTIIIFLIFSIGIYQLSKRLNPDYERIAIIASRTGVFLINFGFWVGSLWGDKHTGILPTVPSAIFSIGWALTLLVTIIWGWKRNRRWVVNTCSVFAGIHFYTQWFHYLGANPATALLAGLMAIFLALGLNSVNSVMKTRENGPVEGQIILSTDNN